MSASSPTLPPDDRRNLSLRLSGMQAVVATVFAALAVAFWVFQVAQHQKFDEMAENNHRRRLPLPAPRGVLFDRNGKVLVENQNTFNIALDREQSGNIDDTLRLLAAATGADEATMHETVNRRRREPSYRPIVLVENATMEQVIAVRARRLELPGIIAQEVPARQYPQSEMGAHLFGYVSEASEADLARPEYAGAESGSMVGKAGVEQSYNKLLMGKDGDRLVVVNSRGREMDEASVNNPDRGPARPADDRRRRPAGDRRGIRALRLQRRRGHPRSAFGRSAVVHEPARLQPEPVRRRHRPRGLEFAAQQRPEAAAEPRPAGTLLARVDVQDCGRRGGARRGRRDAGLPRVLSRRRDVLRPVLPVPPQGRPRFGRHAARDREVVQHLLLHARQDARGRPDSQVVVAARARRAQRDRPAGRAQGARAVDGVEAAESCASAGIPARRSRSRSARARSTSRRFRSRS